MICQEWKAKENWQSKSNWSLYQMKISIVFKHSIYFHKKFKFCFGSWEKSLLYTAVLFLNLHLNSSTFSWMIYFEIVMHKLSKIHFVFSSCLTFERKKKSLNWSTKDFFYLFVSVFIAYQIQSKWYARMTDKHIRKPVKETNATLALF